MSARRVIGSRQVWAVLAWLALAALAVAAVVLEDVSLAIAVGVAVVLALGRGFFPPSAADRP